MNENFVLLQDIKELIIQFDLKEHQYRIQEEHLKK